MKKLLVRIVFIPLGLICAALGIVGMFVPVLPTTPFLLLAGFLFARSSKRLNTWLSSSRAWKTYVQPFLKKQAIPAATKARIFLVSAAVMVVSAYMVKDIQGVNFVVWFILELVMLWLCYLMFVRIPNESQHKGKQMSSMPMSVLD